MWKGEEEGESVQCGAQRSWPGPLVQSEPSAQVVVVALVRLDCWQLWVQLSDILNGQWQLAAQDPEDQNQWDWPRPWSRSFTPLYTNMTDAHECLRHRGQMLPFISSPSSCQPTWAVCRFSLLFLFLPMPGQKKADPPLTSHCHFDTQLQKKIHRTIFSGDVFSLLGADKDSSALSLRQSLIFTFEEMNQTLVGPHLRWSVLYSCQVSRGWNEQRRIKKKKKRKR